MNAITQSLGQLTGNGSVSGLIFVVLVACAVFALSMGVIAVVAGILSPVRRRVGTLANGGIASSGSLADSIGSNLRPLATLFRPKAAKSKLRIEQLMLHAGYRSPNAANIYYGVKSLLILLLPCGVLLASPLLPRWPTSKILLFAVGAGYMASIACTYWLEKRVERRQKALRTAFPDALDLLVVCVESGLGLAPALQRVSEEIGVSHPDLSDELALVNAEMRAGIDRGQALKHLADRTGLTDIRGLTALLVQTMRFGTSIADALRVYSEEFRDKRVQAAEEMAAKLSTKMIFPLVLCLFPSFFLVAVGPAVIGLIDVFTKY